MYIYRLSSGGMTETRRIMLVDGPGGDSGGGGGCSGPVRRDWKSALEADGSVYRLTVSRARRDKVAYAGPDFSDGC